MWNLLLRPLRRWYYRHNYAPQPLGEDIGSTPPHYRLLSVTWLTTQTPACITTAMQMIAAHFGIDRPRRIFDFLMGFTYGAGELPGLGYAPVGTDPEMGYLEAAPYLGLKCHYYFTDDPAHYLQGIRFFLAQGTPVRLPLDMGALYGSADPIPHSEVFIGYDESSFEYYETVCRPPATCRPAVHKPGEEGCIVPDERLLEAVFSQSRFFSYPWNYALSVFGPGPVVEDTKPLWQRNGRNLVGGQQMGMRWGARATEHLAAQVEKQGPKMDREKLALTLEMGAFMRCENAIFLRETYGECPDLQRAADLFEKSAGCFQNGLDALNRGMIPEEAGAIAGWLRDSATAEREAGEIFLTLTDDEILQLSITVSPAPVG